MRKTVVPGIALAIGGLALGGLDPVAVVAVPDGLVAIHSGGLREAVTAVNVGEQVTWINASGAPVVRPLFDAKAGAPDSTGNFTSSISLRFLHPGIYFYTALVGGRAWPVRGKVVVR